MIAALILCGALAAEAPAGELAEPVPAQKTLLQEGLAQLSPFQQFTAPAESDESAEADAAEAPEAKGDEEATAPEDTEFPPADSAATEGEPGAEVAESAERDGETATDDEARAEDLTEGNEAPEPIALPLPSLSAQARRAREPSPKLTVGGGLGLVNIPIESDLDGSGLPLDGYVEGRLPNSFYEKLGITSRLGVNRSEATLSNATVTTTSLYLAGRKAFTFLQPMISYALFGLAYMSTTVSGLSDVSGTDDAGVGVVGGFGMLYPFERFRVGGQYLLLRREGSIGGITFSTGSNQLQIVLDWPLGN